MNTQTSAYQLVQRGFCPCTDFMGLNGYGQNKFPFQATPKGFRQENTNTHTHKHKYLYLESA